MGARVEDLGALLALQTVRVPVEAQRLPPLSKVDRAAALLTFPHPVRQAWGHLGICKVGDWLSQICRDRERQRTSQITITQLNNKTGETQSAEMKLCRSWCHSWG